MVISAAQVITVQKVQDLRLRVMLDIISLATELPMKPGVLSYVFFLSLHFVSHKGRKVGNWVSAE